jgi:uncharacterized protein YndB with AHSA1/START domain
VDSLRIEREILIEAPVDVVWHTITAPEQISQWFADRVELDATPGGRGTFVFDNPGGTSLTAPLVVGAVDEPSRFSFRWGHPDGEEPGPGNSVLVEFTLAVEGTDRTRLRVVETGLEPLTWADSAKEQYAEEHRAGWAGFLDRLAGLLRERSDDRPGA